MAQHKPIPLRESALLGLVSVVLSLMLWLQVSAQAQPNKQREMLIRLQARGLGENLFLTSIPEGISVIAEGPEAQLERLEPGSLTATVSLTNLRAGQHSVRVFLPEVRPPVRLRANRPQVIVSLDALATVQKTVDVDVRGEAPATLQYEGAVAQPSVVTLTGPKSEIDRVQKVRAMLDLSSIRPGLVHQINLEALGRDNVPLSLVAISPDTVNVLPAVTAAATLKTVPISPAWQGQPPFPYRVARYSLSPTTVQLRGDSETLAKLFTVDTQPVDLSQLKANRTFEVDLRLPANVKGPENLRVSVTVEVDRARP